MQQPLGREEMHEQRPFACWISNRSTATDLPEATNCSPGGPGWGEASGRVSRIDRGIWAECCETGQMACREVLLGRSRLSAVPSRRGWLPDHFYRPIRPRGCSM